MFPTVKGPIDQLVDRDVCNVEASGSSPDRSIRRLIVSKVYVFGPMHLFGKTYLPVYKKLVALCEKHFDKVVGTWPDFWDTKETPRRFYDRTYETIKDCDLFICEVSSPSHGVGMELQMAAEHKIPVIALIKIETSISPMVIGLPALKKIIYYKNIEDLITKVENEIKK